MDEERARELLGEAIKPNNRLRGIADYVHWIGNADVVLDGIYPIEYIEAVIWWMKNKKVTHA